MYCEVVLLLDKIMDKITPKAPKSFLFTDRFPCIDNIEHLLDNTYKILILETDIKGSFFFFFNDVFTNIL